MSDDSFQIDGVCEGDADVYRLAAAFLDGSITAPDERALADLLQESPQARREFIGVCMQAQLMASYKVPGIGSGGDGKQAARGWLGGGLLGNLVDLTHGVFSDYARLSILVATMTLGSLLTLLGMWAAPTFQRPVHDEVVATKDTRSLFAAKVVRTSNCRWAEDRLPPLVGQELCGGASLQFSEGIVEIHFRSGAKVLVEGPAELTLLSGSSVQLDQGRLTAEVPEEGVGFSVNTVSAKVVDLGTQFSVFADPGGDVDVYVYEGKVRVTQDTAGRTRHVVLQRGQKVRICDGHMTVVDTAKEADADGELEVGPEQARWREFSSSLGRDKDVVAYYTFDRPFPGAACVANRSSAGADLDGEIDRAEWSDGRWPGKGALQFRDQNARVTIDIPARLEAVTLAAWVRLDAVGPQPQSLLHSDGHTWNRVGAVHWFVDEHGRLCVAVGSAEGEHVDVRPAEGAAGVTPEKWHHLATSIDIVSGEVAFYIDGERIGTEAVEHCEPLRIGTAQLGNASVADCRCLVGSMDELAVFRRVLSKREIEGIFKVGCPEGEAASVEAQ